MHTIWKFAIQMGELDDIVTIQMPKKAKVISAAAQNDDIVIYAEVDPSVLQRTSRKFRIAGTGHPLGPGIVGDRAAFVGTVMLMQGRLVFHVYDMGET